MTTTRIRVPGPRTGDGGKTPFASAFRPKMFDDHQKSLGEGWVVVSDPGDGTLVIEATLGAVTLAAIQANPKYRDAITIVP